MPASRTTPTGSGSTAPQRRALPFKPPGPARQPAKKAKTTANASTSAKNTTSRHTSAAAAPAKAKANGKKVAPVDLSDTDDDVRAAEEADNMDLDDDSADGSAALKKAPNKAKATAARLNPTARAGVQLVEDEEVLSLSDTAPSPPSTASQEEISGVPAPLLTRLLHESFVDKSLKIGKEANEIMRTYVDTFIREAVARAALSKNERAAGDELGDDWLDVEDLERVVPGLLLDF